MKISTILLGGIGLYFASKYLNARCAENLPESALLNTTLAPYALSDENAIIYVQEDGPEINSMSVQADILLQTEDPQEMVNAVNYYYDMARMMQINTDLLPIKKWRLEGDMIRFQEANGVIKLMSYPEFLHYTNTNILSVAKYMENLPVFGD